MGYTPHILVLGGGTTGTAIARDLAIRGFDVTLVERSHLTHGATGRIQGLLHSGARHVASDPDLASRCLRENRILRTVAGHCVETTGGLVVAHAEDDSDPFETLLDSCTEPDIPTEELPKKAAIEREPTLTDDVVRALQVPDCVVDPLRLTVGTARGAVEYGADVRTHTSVIDLIVDDGAVVGALVCPTAQLDGVPDLKKALEDVPTEEIREEILDSSQAFAEDDPDSEPNNSGKQVPGMIEGDRQIPGAVGSQTQSSSGPSNERRGEIDPDAVEAVRADYVINATGAWADQITRMAGVSIPLAYERGSMVVSGVSQPDHVITRCRDGDEANTVVPRGHSTVLGTIKRPATGPADTETEHTEIDHLLDELDALLPGAGEARTLRAHSEVRVVYEGGGDDGTAVNDRGTVLDHSRRDGLWGLTTVLGGTLTTHRLLAKQVVDRVCTAFGVDRSCRTHEIPLPGSEDHSTVTEAVDTQLPVSDLGPERLGSRAERVSDVNGPNPLVCESMGVTRAEIGDALEDETGEQPDLQEIRIRTWAGMGECQGGRCAHRMATMLYPEYDTETVEASLDAFYEERWDGQQGVLLGEQLAQAMRNYAFHVATLNRHVTTRSIDLEAFDDGPDRDEERSVRGGMRP